MVPQALFLLPSIQIIYYILIIQHDEVLILEF